MVNQRKPPLYERATMQPFKSCLNCKHLHTRGVSCDAYPAGIPFDILSGETAHDRPLAGDNGIQYEPDPKAPLGLPEGWTLIKALKELERKR
jgi:hypothetical protein